MVDMQAYRDSDAEQRRIDDLMQLVPAGGDSVLDVGARDGYFSRLLAERFNTVTALDLQTPSIVHARIHCVEGDITGLTFEDRAFDLVFCAEVLEHIPPGQLAQACSELSRVTRADLLIGVPYKQDLRVGRTSCTSCGKKNPPWGHVNRFDDKVLARLFQSLELKAVSYVGEAGGETNLLSAWLMDLAGNPYGTYSQEEGCIHCGEALREPPAMTLVQKVLAKLAVIANNVQRLFTSPHPNWVHLQFHKYSV